MLLGERKPRGRSRRPEVFERDHGVCKDCGLDCEALRQAYLAAVEEDRQGEYRVCAVCDAYLEDGWSGRQCNYCGSDGSRKRSKHPTVARQSVEERLQAVGFTPKDCARLRASDGREPSLWEADHTVPLSEGGADTLENMRTLCLPHHRIWSAGLAHRRGITKTLRTRAAKRKARRRA